jgi:hypothetical protein
MNVLNRLAFPLRLLAAAAAVVTAGLFAGVVTLGEPQRSQLIAKVATQERLASNAAGVRVAQAAR